MREKYTFIFQTTNDIMDTVKEIFDQHRTVPTLS